MNKTLISIIIPVYNSQDYVKKCIDSIINQTYQNLEIIIVNDGSTDNSGDIIEEYGNKDRRIKVFHKENGGIGSAYNVALKHVTGDLLTFVDSDDWPNLNLYEEIIDIYNKTNPDFISFGKIYLNGNGENLKAGQKSVDRIIQDRDSIIKFHFEEMKHPSLGRIFKKELFNDTVIYDQNIGIDEMLIPQLLAKCNKAVYTSKVLYNVLVRQDSVSRAAYNEKKILQTIKVNRFVCEYMDKNIPNYATISHFKYLNTLYAILHQSNIDSNLMSSSVANEIKSDIKTTYNTVKATVEFKNLPVHLKFFIYLIVNFPIMYKLIVKSVKLLRAKR